MSDPFQPAEHKLRITEEFLGALRDYRYPTVVSTRSPLIREKRFVDLLKGSRVVVQFSFSTIHDKDAEQVEPLAPRPSEILATMSILSREGIPVTARWQPYIPRFSPAPSEFVDAVAEAGACQVSLEHLKIPTERSGVVSLKASRRTLESLLVQYAALSARRDGRELVLPAKTKLPVVLAVRAACHARGVLFGAGDNEFQYLSDGNGCCSSVDIVGNFRSVYRFTIPQMLKQQIGSDSEIFFQDTGDWRPKGAIDRFLNSKSRLFKRTGSGVRDVEFYLRHKWNDLSGFDAPTKYYGVKFLGYRDKHGMNVYGWSRSDLEHLKL